MGCSSCTTNNKDGKPRGCKSNGACATGGCEKLHVFDWLADVELPNGQKKFPIVEVRFKNGRKHFFRNEKEIPLYMGDLVTVEGNPGHDVGTVSLTGELVKVQMKKRKITEDHEDIKRIFRKSTLKDIDIWKQARDKEIETQRIGREIVSRLGLKMKLSDIEYQGDGNKATFYYTAEDRVDFRQLIKDLAATFNIRVEMRQVGLRQEAARLGGVGSCGRELCCSTWLTDFRKVNTASARYQQLSLNPLKLAGQCGKLKCCLNFELDTYLDALKDFPKQEKVIQTESGLATFVKMDIFKGLMWYTYKDNSSKWYKLDKEQVKEMLLANQEGEKAPALEDVEEDQVQETKIEFENVVGQDSITRFDKPKKKRRNFKGRKRNNQNNAKNNNPDQKESNENKRRNPQRNQQKNQRNNTKGGDNNKKPEGNQNNNSRPNKPKKRRPPRNQQNQSKNKDA